MKKKKPKENQLLKIENFLAVNQDLDFNSKTFNKIMFIYSVGVKELKNKLEIIKDEFEIFYDYNLIDHINTRIKKPESIKDKMEHKNLNLTYKEMIENVNDIAGIRVICPLKKDIFSIRDLIEKMDNIEILKEKDYVTKPKKSGYSSYHMILEVPIILSQKTMYVKVELQIRTMAMDFWASLEHSMKYKPKNELTKAQSKELVSYAKMINKIDSKIELIGT